MGHVRPQPFESRVVRHPDQLLREDAVLVRELREVVGRLGVCEEDGAAPAQRAAGGRRAVGTAAGGGGVAASGGGGSVARAGAATHPRRR